MVENPQARKEWQNGGSGKAAPGACRRFEAEHREELLPTRRRRQQVVVRPPAVKRQGAAVTTPRQLLHIQPVKRNKQRRQCVARCRPRVRRRWLPHQARSPARRRPSLVPAGRHRRLVAFAQQHTVLSSLLLQRCSRQQINQRTSAEQGRRRHRCRPHAARRSVWVALPCSAQRR